MTLNPAVLVITGGFALYFLIAGTLALVRGRISVVNPQSRSAYPGLLGALIYSQRPPNPLDPYPAAHVEATGAQAKRRGWLYIIIGLLFVALGLFATLVENDVL